MIGEFKFDTFNESLDIDLALKMSLLEIKPEGVESCYHAFFTFVVDKVAPSKDEGITNYFVRCKGRRKDKTVILQSNWKGMGKFVVSKETKK